MPIIAQRYKKKVKDDSANFHFFATTLYFLIKAIMSTPLCRALVVYCLFVNHPLILRQPSTPIIAKPAY